MRIEQALEHFVVQLEADGRSLNTRRQYERHGRLLASYFREREIEEIGHEDVARFFTSRSVTHRADRSPKRAATLNALRSSVRALFRYLHGAGYVRADPSRLLRRARTGTPPPRALSIEEERRFFDALDGANGFEAERDRMLFGLMRATGIRLASALALTAEDIDLDEGIMVLRRTKGDRVQHAYLPAKMRDRLADWITRRGKGCLFPSREGGAISARQAQRRFTVSARRAGCPEATSPHVLRHCFAMSLYEHTSDIALVQAALGHRSITSTLGYARAGEHAVRMAMEDGGARWTRS